MLSFRRAVPRAPVVRRDVPRLPQSIVPLALLVLAAATPALVRAQADTPAAAPAPVAGYTTHVVATHFLGERTYETHHYFKPLREGVLQGLVFRSTDAGATLIELEWAIAASVYDALPAAERRHWHPLFPAVDAGRVRLPDLSAEEERTMLQTVRGLYAQTINLAGIDGALPSGVVGVALATHLTPEEMRAVMRGGR